MKRSNRRRESGSVLIEGALMMIPLTLILIGTTVVGLNLGVAVHATQVTRDLGSMYVRGVNFSKPTNRDLAVRLAEGLGLSANGGDGVVYLSKVTFVSNTTCMNLHLVPCNADRLVVTQRVVIGNPSVSTSSVGTPASNLLSTDGLVNNYKQESTAVANLSGITLQEGEYAYVAETYFDVVRLSLTGAPTRGVHTIAVF